MSSNNAKIEKMSPREETLRGALLEHGINLPEEDIRRIAQANSQDMHALLLNELRSLKNSPTDAATLAKQLEQINRKLDQTVKKESFLWKATKFMGNSAYNILAFPFRYPVITIVGILGTAYFGLPKLFEYMADEEFEHMKTTSEWFERYQKSLDELEPGFGGRPADAGTILGGPRTNRVRVQP